MRVISTFGRCDICDRRSPLSRQNRWQLPLSVLGSIIATASCTALYGAEPQPSPEATERDGSRRASGFLPDERHGSAPTAALVTDQTTDHVQASDPYFQGVYYRLYPTVSSRTASRPSSCQNTSLYYRSTVLPTMYVHRLRLSGVLLFCTSSLELSRDIHKIGEHFQ